MGCLIGFTLILQNPYWNCGLVPNVLLIFTLEWHLRNFFYHLLISPVSNPSLMLKTELYMAKASSSFDCADIWKNLTII